MINVKACAATAALLGLLTLAGCGGGGTADVPVKGRIVEKGAPLKISIANMPPGLKAVQLGFHASPKAGQSGDVYFANVDAADGTFTVAGPKGKGVPPGKYRISLAAAGGGFNPAAAGPGRPAGPPTGAPPGPPSGGLAGFGDRYKGAFAPENTPLTVDIAAPAKTVVIDPVEKKVTLE